MVLKLCMLAKLSREARNTVDDCFSSCSFFYISKKVWFEFPGLNSGKMSSFFASWFTCLFDFVFIRPRDDYIHFISILVFTENSNESQTFNYLVALLQVLFCHQVAFDFSFLSNRVS